MLFQVAVACQVIFETKTVTNIPEGKHKMKKEYMKKKTYNKLHLTHL